MDNVKGKYFLRASNSLKGQVEGVVSLIQKEYGPSDISCHFQQQNRANPNSQQTGRERNTRMCTPPHSFFSCPSISCQHLPVALTQMEATAQGNLWIQVHTDQSSRVEKCGEWICGGKWKINNTVLKRNLFS